MPRLLIRGDAGECNCCGEGPTGDLGLVFAIGVEGDLGDGDAVGRQEIWLVEGDEAFDVAVEFGGANRGGNAG